MGMGASSGSQLDMPLEKDGVEACALCKDFFMKPGAHNLSELWKKICIPSPWSLHTSFRFALDGSCYS